jgi:hypothetical protein
VLLPNGAVFGDPVLLIEHAGNGVAVMADEFALEHLPVTVEAAVMVFPAERADTVFVQVVPATDAVPTEILFTNTSTEAPDSFVPETVVAPSQTGFTVGAAALSNTVTAVEAALLQLPAEVALAVITSPAESADTVELHAPFATVAVPI